MVEQTWVVRTLPDGYETVAPNGDVARIQKAEIAAVAIATTDEGPFTADVWWVLYRQGDQVGAAWPQGAAGEEQALDALMALPGFDHEAMISAMGSTENAIFPVWKTP